MGEEMEHGLIRPFALVHIIDVLREAGKIYNAEIRTASREAVRRRFSNIIEARPNELSTDIRRMLDYVPSLFMGAAPRCVHIVICRAHKRGICIWHPPFLRCYIDAVGRHHIVASCLKGRYTLTHYERLIWEILWHVLNPLMVIVETDNIDSPALEEMVLRIGFIAACCDGTSLVVFLYDIG